MTTPVSSRFVPGAPPPAPLSKTQKKKRRAAKKDGGESDPETPAASTVVLPDAHAAALTEKAPEEKDVKNGDVAEELVAKPEAPKSEAGDGIGPKGSPVGELLNKRLKAIGKKITRIHTYSSKPASELNDDQKKTLATLPSLEAVRKELEETKKAVETLELEQAKEAANVRAAAEEAERQRIAETIAEVQKEYAERIAQILDFIRFHSLLSNADPSVQALNLVQAEINAVYATANALLAQEAESKQAALRGFLLGEGEIEGISFGRLIEILEEHSRPSVQEELAAEAEQVADAVVEAIAEAEAEVDEKDTVESGLPPPYSSVPSASGHINLTFMQESELEGDQVAFENGAEWVEKEEMPQGPTEVSVSVQVQESYVPDEPVESHQPEQAENGALDWADDERELPSIAGLHATFGTSGSGTPANGATSAEQLEPEPSTKAQVPSNEGTEAPPNGNVQGAVTDQEGFIPARSDRARRGRGFRGGERGAFRGGDRGGYRGGRGGGRGGRASEHSSNWRSQGSYSEGEQRGRRGRGRGFDRDRGGHGARGGRGGVTGES